MQTEIPMFVLTLLKILEARKTADRNTFKFALGAMTPKGLSRPAQKKGSLIWVSGSLELETFTKRDGITTDKRLKLLLDNWGFIPAPASKEHPRSAEQPSPETPAPMKAPEIDGDREPLPV